MELVENPIARFAAFSAQRSWVQFPSPVLMADDVLPVRNLFSGYTVYYQKETSQVIVFCDRCDQLVYECPESRDLSKMELYERVIDAHKRLNRKI